MWGVVGTVAKREDHCLPKAITWLQPILPVGM